MSNKDMALSRFRYKVISYNDNVFKFRFLPGGLSDYQNNIQAAIAAITESPGFHANTAETSLGSIQSQLELDDDRILYITLTTEDKQFVFDDNIIIGGLPFNSALRALIDHAIQSPVLTLNFKITSIISQVYPNLDGFYITCTITSQSTFSNATKALIEQMPSTARNVPQPAEISVKTTQDDNSSITVNVYHIDVEIAHKDQYLGYSSQEKGRLLTAYAAYLDTFLKLMSSV